ncbi:MAG: UDP-N-acetyl-D-glucosamine dehydrogenase [Deltaproteobacteria bacterium RIFOXYA12_FULL_58_15]|nr:MAG: UDP-N-acetyl-D-glucosamine dehydrogenase [Deltaproteobacteria bacterium RIFOXYA12_FULL_58_15]OGR10306.1 MAG: UDP-N-acetyl-D-glucosamine dehydrogenase [Deltaproteobacteria bacterium RIFOXYB12_FULL_58_9]
MNTRELIDRFEKGEAVIGIVGLGYVGLPLILTYGKKKFKTLGFDIDPKKVEALKAGRSYIKHIPTARIKELVDSGSFDATTDFNRVPEADALLLCVPTPLNKNREPDMRFIVSTAEGIGPHLRKGQIVVLESTTYPGTTDELLKDILERTSGLKAGEDFVLAYSPEREDPGNPNFDTQRIPKVVGAMSAEGLEAAVALYRAALDKVIPVSSTRVAEMTKLLENIFRSVNIALVNEMKVVCERMGVDVWEVIDAAASKPFGFMPFYPGPGLGGHCIPIDPFYLTWKAREYELNTRFIELAGEVNTNMPHYVIERTASALNAHKKPLNGSRILVLGAAYKRDIDDMRESPSLRVIELLQETGAEVSYHDPYVPRLPKMRRYNLDMESVALNAKSLHSYDAVIIVTDHTNVDYEMVVANAPLIIDTRNATRNITTGRDKIVKA